MSIIQNIREKAAWLVFIVIALSLIGFLLMDAKPGQGGLFGGNSTIVGSINGKKIDYLHYQEKMKLMEDQYAAQGYPMNDPMRQNLQDQVWNQFVQEDLLQEQADKLGMQVTPKELDDLLFVNPSPELRQSLVDPQTGQYDPNKLKQQIAQIKKAKDKTVQKQLSDYLSGLVSQRLTEKYNSLLGNTAYVPKWLVEKTIADNSAMASISYVSIPYSTVSDSAVKVTDEDVADFVSKHKTEYKQEASRSISYVVFNAAPNAKDTATTLNDIQKLKADFATTNDAPAFLVRNGSETNYTDAFVSKSKMTGPFADSVRGLSIGAVYGPYLEGNKYTLAKMIGERSMPDSVKCRHILIGTADPKTGQAKLADSTAKKRADSIAAAVKGGADFAALVTKYTDDEGSKTKAGEYDFAADQFGQLAPEFAETIFYGAAGDKKVVKTQFGYHYIEVLSQKNFQPAYKVAYLSKSVIVSDETDHTASGLANQFAGESRTEKAFEDNIVKRKYTKLVATDIKPTAIVISSLGSSRALARWIYEAKKGDVSVPYSVGDKYVVAMVTEIEEEGPMSVSKARPQVENLIRNKKKADQIIKKLGNATTLDAVAKAGTSQIVTADSVMFSNGILPQVGQEAKVVGAVFNKQWQGKPSPIITGNGGVFIVQTANIGAIPNASGDVEAQRKNMEAQIKQSSTYRSSEALKKAATIKDNRGKFL